MSTEHRIGQRGPRAPHNLARPAKNDVTHDDIGMRPQMKRMPYPIASCPSRKSQNSAIEIAKTADSVAITVILVASIMPPFLERSENGWLSEMVKDADGIDLHCPSEGTYGEVPDFRPSILEIYGDVGG